MLQQILYYSVTDIYKILLIGDDVLSVDYVIPFYEDGFSQRKTNYRGKTNSQLS